MVNSKWLSPSQNRIVKSSTDKQVRTAMGRATRSIPKKNQKGRHKKFYSELLKIRKEDRKR